VKKEKIGALHLSRESGTMSREAYWMEMKEFLESVSDFASLQKLFGNQILIQDGHLLVNLKVTRTHNSRLLMILDETDIRSVPFSVLADGYYEPFQSDILVELGKNSGKFLDIGANMGFYSLALATENPELTVISFEPQPSVYEKMIKNIEMNNLQGRIKLLNMGLGHQIDELTMFIPKFTGTGGASFKNLHEDEGEAKEIKVPVVTLDALETDPVDLIKIDVEGFELNVISGAISLISQHRPSIVAELLRKWMKPFGHTPQMFLDELASLDYRCFAISEARLIEIEEIDQNTYETNFIFVHQDRSDHLDVVQKYVATS